MDSPELFGMDHNADKAFLASQGRALIGDLSAAQPRLPAAAAVGYELPINGLLKTHSPSDWRVF